MAKVEKEKEEAVKVHNVDMTRIKEQDKSIIKLHTNLKTAKDSITSKDIENQRMLETLEQLRGNSFVLQCFEENLFFSWCNFEGNFTYQRGHRGCAWLYQDPLILHHLDFSVTKQLPPKKLSWVQQESQL